jgi:hypothetical protein
MTGAASLAASGLSVSDTAAAFLSILAVPLGGVSIEHLLENYVMGWLPQKYKTMMPDYKAEDYAKVYFAGDE